MQKSVSVIVPLYNVKDYLVRCVDSIRKQTYKDMEILLIDDGSSDGSEGICDRLASIDNRIKVLHLKKGGLIRARKEGIAQARGSYTLFIDSDDWIEDTMVEFLVENAVSENADIVTSGLFVEKAWSSIKRLDTSKAGIYEKDRKKELYQNLMYDGRGQYGIMPSLVTKLIRTSLLRRIYSGLCEKINYCEDAAVVYSSCIHASKIVVTHVAFYHYWQREDSMTHNEDMHFFSGLNEVYLFIRQNLEGSEYKTILKRQLDAYFVDKCLLGINRLFGLNNNKILIPCYFFINNIIPEDSKVVLYGAGNIGQDFHIQIQKEKIFQLAGWIDKDYKKFQDQGIDVQSADIFNGLQYDYVILAFKYLEVAKKVREKLIRQYDIEPEKFVWFEPKEVLEEYLKLLSLT